MNTASIRSNYFHVTLMLILVLVGVMGAAGGYGQKPQDTVYFAYYDPFLDVGYQVLSPDSLGEVYYTCEMDAHGDLRPTLWLHGRAKLINLYGVYSIDGKKEEGFPTPKVNTRFFAWIKHGTKTAIRVATEDRFASTSSRWRTDAWEQRSRSQFLRLEFYSNVPCRAPQKRRRAQRMDYNMPDTSAAHFRMRHTRCAYRSDTVEWRQEIWLIDRSDPHLVLRSLQYRMVRRMQLPMADPYRVIGPWGLIFFGAMGDLVEEVDLRRF